MPAIAVHHTATENSAWDGPAAVAAMPNDDEVLEYCHAWQSAEAASEEHEEGDDDADDQKGSYKFPHHRTKGGPANIPACHNGLARLAGADIPDADRAGVRAHLQAHIDDANKKGAHMRTVDRELRTATPAEVLREHRSAMATKGTRSRHTQARPRTEFELRARPDGTGGTSYFFTGYAAAFEAPFEMWDFWGDPYFETLGIGSCNRTLANGADVQFLIGHNEAGIPLARTKSGTMTLSADSYGLLVEVPSLDGRSPTVQSLASAMERGDMDEMSIGFMAVQQQWSPDWMERRITEINLNRGDVSMVCWAANPAANGASLVAFPVSEAAARSAGVVEQRAGSPAGSAAADTDEQGDDSGQADNDAMPPGFDATSHGPGSPVCPECKMPNATDARFCDQCGNGLYDNDGLIEDPLAFSRQARVRVLALKR